MRQSPALLGSAPDLWLVSRDTAQPRGPTGQGHAAAEVQTPNWCLLSSPTRTAAWVPRTILSTYEDGLLPGKNRSGSAYLSLCATVGSSLWLETGTGVSSVLGWLDLRVYHITTGYYVWQVVLPFTLCALTITIWLGLTGYAVRHLNVEETKIRVKLHTGRPQSWSKKQSESGMKDMTLNADITHTLSPLSPNHCNYKYPVTTSARMSPQPCRWCRPCFNTVVPTPGELGS